MADEAKDDKITTTRDKDPAAVERGKELGKNSTAFKEAKIRKKIASEWGPWDMLALAGVCGLGLSVFNTYTNSVTPERKVYIREPAAVSDPPVQAPKVEPVVVVETPKPKKSSLFIDDITGC